MFQVVAHALLPICYLEKADGQSDVYRPVGCRREAVHGDPGRLL